MITSTIPAAEIVWDASMLTRMVGDNLEMQRRLLDKFLHGTEEFVSIIDAAAASGNLQTVVAVAHKMKSSASTVGALRLGELCQALEISAGENNLEAVLEQAAGLEAAYLDVANKIKNSFMKL